MLAFLRAPFSLLADLQCFIWDLGSTYAVLSIPTTHKSSATAVISSFSPTARKKACCHLSSNFFAGKHMSLLHCPLDQVYACFTVSSCQSNLVAKTSNNVKLLYSAVLAMAIQNYLVLFEKKCMKIQATQLQDIPEDKRNRLTVLLYLPTLPVNIHISKLNNNIKAHLTKWMILIWTRIPITYCNSGFHDRGIAL